MSPDPAQRQLSGYHMEALAVETFADYQGPRTTKAMLSHFFERAARLVRTPIKDVTGQSDIVDAYLGEPGSLQRRVASDALDRVARQFRNADGAKSPTMWLGILGDP